MKFLSATLALSGVVNMAITFNPINPWPDFTFACCWVDILAAIFLWESKL